MIDRAELPAAGDGLRVAFVGDNVGIGHPEGLAFFYREIAGELATVDIRFGNLEWPITDGDGAEAALPGRPAGHMVPTDADALHDVGFDVVSVANNHIMDHGPQAMLRTLELLDERGILHCGAGPDASSAHAPALIERNGLRIAFLAYTAVFLLPGHPTPPPPDVPQMAMLRVTTSYEVPHRVFEQPGTPATAQTKPDPDDLARIEADIRSAREIADIVIVSWHWGVSGGYRRRVQYQMDVGHRCIDAGAAAVIGHHPHVLQGVERYHGGALCYSLSNFVFWKFKMPPAIHDSYSVIAEATFTADGLKAFGLVPIDFNEFGQPVPASLERSLEVLSVLQRDSTELGSRLEVKDGFIEVEGR